MIWLLPALLLVGLSVAKAAHSLGYTLKSEQKAFIVQYASGNDVSVSLPSGYALIFYLLSGVKGKSIVMVVSPLLALMKDRSITEKGLTAINISDKDSAPPTVRTAIQNGKYQVVFTSPECLFVFY